LLPRVDQRVPTDQQEGGDLGLELVRFVRTLLTMQDVRTWRIVTSSRSTGAGKQTYGYGW
jgi:hypothetical protein